MTRTLGSFLKLDAEMFTPNDSPSRSPESCAIQTLQRYYRDVRNFGNPLPKMGLAEYLRLNYAISDLLCDHVITQKLGRQMAETVANRFLKNGRAW